MRTHKRSRSDVMARSPMGARRGIQIGPRIRIGGTLGKIGQNVKEGAGKVLGNPITQGVLGATLGPWVAAGAGALGRTLDTTKGSVGVGDIVKGGATGGAYGLGGSLVRGGLGKIGGLGGLIRGGGADGKGNFGALGDLAGKVGGSVLGGSLMPGGLKGAAGMGGGDLLSLGLGGLSAFNAAQLGKKSGEFAQKAHDQAYSNWDSRAPLRIAGVQGMLNPTPSAQGKQTIANLGGIARRNPFAMKMGGTG